MATKDTKAMTVETVERQERYVASQKRRGSGLGIVFADAFLRGMRDIGYKSPSWGLAEQIDNAFQAAADVVSLRLGFNSDNKSQAKPDQLALSDNGNGMIPEMISYAVRWGGTDREDDRKGFGRYGYGLPSSAVSLAKRYSVYSKVPGQPWHSVTVDIEELARAADDVNKTATLLSPRKAELPKWLVKAEDKIDLATADSGTVIVFEDIDRLRRLTGWILAKVLREKLLKDFGVIYRHWLPQRRIFIDGTETLPVDPLFLMEHARFYDETPVRSQRVPARTLEIVTPRGTTGTVTIRASLLPPNFQLVDPDEYPTKGAKTNKRFEFMKAYNGILVCRERRQIDCIAPRFTKFQNKDYNVKIELDFDPELDEFFGITTSKQQIVIDDEMWEKLQHSGKDGGGLIALVRDIRNSLDDVEKDLKAKAANDTKSEEKPRASITAMQRSAKFKGKVPERSTEKKQAAEKNVEEEAKERSKASGRTKEEEAEQLRKKAEKWPFDVRFESIPEGPFYLAKSLGEQYVLVINTDHPFFTKLYDPTPAARGALEILLFVLAERELDCEGAQATFYKSERHCWSERLRRAYDEYVDDETIHDEESAADENAQMAADVG